MHGLLILYGTAHVIVYAFSVDFIDCVTYFLHSSLLKDRRMQARSCATSKAENPLRLCLD